MLLFDTIIRIFYIAGYDGKEDGFLIETHEKSVRQGLSWLVAILTALVSAILFIPMLKRLFSFSDRDKEFMILFSMTTILGGILGYWFIATYYTDNKIKTIVQSKKQKLSTTQARFYLAIFSIVWFIILMVLIMWLLTVA